jgi:hypothetical protein
MCQHIFHTKYPLHERKHLLPRADTLEVQVTLERLGPDQLHARPPAAAEEANHLYQRVTLSHSVRNPINDIPISMPLQGSRYIIYLYQRHFRIRDILYTYINATSGFEIYYIPISTPLQGSSYIIYLYQRHFRVRGEGFDLWVLVLTDARYIEVVGFSLYIEVVGFSLYIEVVGFTPYIEVVGFSPYIEVVGFSLYLEVVGFSLYLEVVGFSLYLEVVGFSLYI